MDFMSQVNKYNRYIYENFKPFLGESILDVGCGNGPLAGFFASSEYVGADIDDESLARARRLHPEHLFCKMDDIPKNQRFACIVGLAVIEHVPAPEKFLAALKDRLSTDGTIVLTTPHPAFGRFYHWGSRIGLFSRVAADEHKNEYDRATIKRMAEKVGLAITHYQRFLFEANQLIVLKAT